MEVVVKGRRLTQDVGESFREHCHTKLARLERLDGRLQRLDVELSHEPNPRLSAHCERVEITVRTRGPVVRAEASAPECYAAFEKAYAKVEERLRRAADRRTTSHSHSHHNPVHHAAAVPPQSTAPQVETAPGDGLAADEREVAGGVVVREKAHEAEPMRIGDALHQMELVGHDFFLFLDAETAQPSVVYRRRGYDYGVLRLVAAVPALTAL